MHSINPKSMNFFLTELAQRHNEKWALSFVEEKVFKYSDLLKVSYQIAKKLESKNIKEREKVIILSENSPWYAPTYLGITASNRVVVPVLTDFSLNEISNILDHSEATAFFVSKKLASKIEPLMKEKKKVSFFEMEDFQTDSKETENLSLEEATAFFTSYKIDEDSLCALIYTSGTTGKSKGVMLSHKNLLTNIESIVNVGFEFTSFTSLSILPLAHALECTIGMLFQLFQGVHIHYLSRTLTVPLLMQSLKTVQPGVILLVPIMFEKIYQKTVLAKMQSNFITAALYKFPPFRKFVHKKGGEKLFQAFGGKMFYCGIGGSKLAFETERFLSEGKFPYSIGYGLTETAPVLAGSTAKGCRFGSAGAIIPGVEIKIDAPNEEGIGELLAKGDMVMQGYYKEPELTASVMTEDNYFRTGDLGIVKDGYIYLSGRSKNIIINSNGENIYPENIESEINNCPFVEDSIVYANKKNSIVAKINLNYEEYKKHLETFHQDKFHNTINKIQDKISHKKTQKNTEALFQEKVNEHLTAIQQMVNKKISKGSRINIVLEQKELFEKTPKKSIKRYLYVENNK